MFAQSLQLYDGLVGASFGGNAVPLVGLFGIILQPIRNICIAVSRIGLVAQHQSGLPVAVACGEPKQEVGISDIPLTLESYSLDENRIRIRLGAIAAQARDEGTRPVAFTYGRRITIPGLKQIRIGHLWRRRFRQWWRCRLPVINHQPYD